MDVLETVLAIPSSITSSSSSTAATEPLPVGLIDGYDYQQLHDAVSLLMRMRGMDESNDHCARDTRSSAENSDEREDRKKEGNRQKIPRTCGDMLNICRNTLDLLIAIGSGHETDPTSAHIHINFHRLLRSPWDELCTVRNVWGEPQLPPLRPSTISELMGLTSKNTLGLCGREIRMKMVRNWVATMGGRKHLAAAPGSQCEGREKDNQMETAPSFSSGDYQDVHGKTPSVPSLPLLRFPPLCPSRSRPSPPSFETLNTHIENLATLSLLPSNGHVRVPFPKGLGLDVSERTNSGNGDDRRCSPSPQMAANLAAILDIGAAVRTAVFVAAHYEQYLSSSATNASSATTAGGESQGNSMSPVNNTITTSTEKGDAAQLGVRKTRGDINDEKNGGRAHGHLMNDRTGALESICGTHSDDGGGDDSVQTSEDLIAALRCTLKLCNRWSALLEKARKEVNSSVSSGRGRHTQAPTRRLTRRSSRRARAHAPHSRSEESNFVEEGPCKANDDTDDSLSRQKQRQENLNRFLEKQQALQDTLRQSVSVRYRRCLAMYALQKMAIALPYGLATAMSLRTIDVPALLKEACPEERAIRPGVAVGGCDHATTTMPLKEHGTTGGSARRTEARIEGMRCTRGEDNRGTRRAAASRLIEAIYARAALPLGKDLQQNMAGCTSIYGAVNERDRGGGITWIGKRQDSGSAVKETARAIHTAVDAVAKIYGIEGWVLSSLFSMV